MNIAHRLLSTAKIKFEKQKSRLTFAAAFVCCEIKIYFSALHLRQLSSATKFKKMVCKFYFKYMQKQKHKLTFIIHTYINRMTSFP